MGLSVNSLAAGVGASVRNVQFTSEAVVVPRKILCVGTYDPSKTDVTPEVPVQVFSAEDAGDKFGFGFMLHRLVKKAFEGSNGIECWVVPQEETGTNATYVLSATVTTALAGTIYLYINGDLVTVDVASGDADTDIATAIAAAVNDERDCVVDATANSADVEFVVKSKGAFWGEGVTIEVNVNGESLPAGVGITVAQTVSGAGLPDIADALDALGTGDDANQDYFTDAVHGYGYETSTLDAISAYVGEGNGFTGLYDKLVHRPMRFLTGDVTAGSAGLAALIVIGDGRKNDRANGIIAVPGSQSHPSEIAALAIGNMARLNNDRAEEHYVGVILSGVFPGDVADRWTSDYDSRDQAVKAGISPTKYSNGDVVMQNVITFYHPDSIPVSSNGYRSMRNISIIQNILFNVAANFEQEKWKGISIVADVVKVTNITSRSKARDVEAVKDDLVVLAKDFESKAWIYEAAYTIDKLKESTAVQVRTGTTGFDSVLSVIFSGEGSILDTVVEFDTSIAVLTR